jgi:phage terminase small subunit
VNPKDTAIPASASEEWAKNLDDKERLFVEGYLQTLNKKQAAEHAGHTHESARKYAYTIFNRPHVREAIELSLRTRTGITKPWIVDKLAAIIDTNLADIGSWDVDGTFVLLPSEDLTNEQKVAISEVATEYGKNGRTTKVKLHDKLAAMAQLSKLLNMLVDRQEISGPDGGPVEVTDHRARITERLNDIAKRTAPDNDRASGSAYYPVRNIGYTRRARK